jgi:tRNA-binding EMAP/Myf-like protein
VVGQVIKVRPHPYGDHIWLADVDIAADYQPQIVWGGERVVEEGSFVPVALPGTCLPIGKIRRRRYRGEVSEGMLCSLAELGWDASVTDKVALLDPSVGLRPGESLDGRDRDWRAIVLRGPNLAECRQRALV